MGIPFVFKHKSLPLNTCFVHHTGENKNNIKQLVKDISIELASNEKDILLATNTNAINLSDFLHTKKSLEERLAELKLRLQKPDYTEFMVVSVNGNKYSTFSSEKILETGQSTNLLEPRYRGDIKFQKCSQDLIVKTKEANLLVVKK